MNRGGHNGLWVKRNKNNRKNRTRKIGNKKLLMHEGIVRVVKSLWGFFVKTFLTFLHAA